MVNCPNCGVRLLRTTKQYKIFLGLTDQPWALMPVTELSCHCTFNVVLLHIAVGKESIVITGDAEGREQ